MLALYGKNDRRVGAAFHNLGIACLRSGNMTKAFDTIEEAISIRKATLGKFHSKVSVSGSVFVRIFCYTGTDIYHHELSIGILGLVC